jgi:uncharacterized protein involved in exopolysaccharide biosynthesis
MTTRPERLREGHTHSSWVDRILAAVQHRFWTVVAISLVFGAGLLALSNMIRPTYRGITVLAPADLDKKGMSGGLGSALGSVSGFAALADLGFGGNDTATEEAIAVLKSQELTQKFIQDHSLLPQLFPKSWDAANRRWKPEKKPPTLGAGFRAFDGLRKVKKDQKTGLITLQVDWKDPVQAATFANDLVDQLNEEMRQRALVQAEASVGYLQKELASTVDVSTHEAISHLMEDQIKQEMLAHVTKEYSLRVVDRAIPADLDAPVKPIKILYLAVGLFLGGCIGTGVAVRMDRRAAMKRGEP